tara:strand:- start:23486 stop:24505 length:1020 start_codon:yes stop_codon:yes gene_type:complete
MVLKFSITQKTAHDQLYKDFSNRQFAKVYLFHGPSGAGKLETALFFSKKKLCELSDPPCENCLSCKKFNLGTHLDFFRISLHDDKKRGRIETIRQEILPRVYQKANEGICKVFVFHGAENITLSSFNALLKVIEEPPPNTFFIFITSNLYSIPITIFSRCRKVRFHPLTRDMIKERLSENYEGKEENIDKLVSLNFSNIESISVDQIEVAEKCRDQSFNFLKEALRPSDQVDPIKLMNFTTLKFDNSKTQRDNAISFLISVRSLLRDVLALQLRAEDFLWNVDIEEYLREISSNWDQVKLANAFFILEKSIKGLQDLNTNPTLTLESLVHSIRSLLVER